MVELSLYAPKPSARPKLAVPTTKLWSGVPIAMVLWEDVPWEHVVARLTVPEREYHLSELWYAIKARTSLNPNKRDVDVPSSLRHRISRSAWTIPNLLEAAAAIVWESLPAASRRGPLASVYADTDATKAPVSFLLPDGPLGERALDDSMAVIQRLVDTKQPRWTELFATYINA